MASDKSKKGLLVGFLLVLLLLIAAVSYIVYDKVLTPSQNNVVEDEDSAEDERKEEGEVSLDIQSDLVQNLYNTFRETRDCTSFSSMKDFTSNDESKLYLAYQQIPQGDMLEMNCSRLTLFYSDSGHYCGQSMNQGMLDNMSDPNSSAFQEAIKSNSTVTVSRTLLDQKVRELFGENVSIAPQNFKAGIGPMMMYDANQDLYAFYNVNAGGECSLGTQELTGAVQKGDEIRITSFITYPVDLLKDSLEVTYVLTWEESTKHYILIERIENVVS